MKARAVAFASGLLLVNGARNVAAFQTHAHLSITQGAINELPLDEAPDIRAKFSDVIIENTA